MEDFEQNIENDIAIPKINENRVNLTFSFSFFMNFSRSNLGILKSTLSSSLSFLFFAIVEGYSSYLKYLGLY